jgi:hypothetical protein
MHRYAIETAIKNPYHVPRRSSDDQELAEKLNITPGQLRHVARKHPLPEPVRKHVGRATGKHNTWCDPRTLKTWLKEHHANHA